MTDMHDTADLVSKALRRAWQLGQTYWQQADSEYQSHWKKADATQATFDQLVEDTRAAILTSNSGAQPAPSVPNGWKEAAIAWEVCASIHREYGKGKDPFFNTRQGDFVKHANDARAKLAVAPEAKP